MELRNKGECIILKSYFSIVPRVLARVVYTCQRFLSAMREFFVYYILPNFRKFLTILNHYRKCSEDFRTLPKIPEDVLMISEGCLLIRWEARNLGAILLACYLGHLAPFTGLFWVEIQFK